MPFASLLHMTGTLMTFVTSFAMMRERWLISLVFSASESSRDFPVSRL